MNSVTLEQLRPIAAKHHLELVRDPFHGANAFEFRRAENGRYICVGAILSVDRAEIYRRYLDRRNSFIHRRLWFMEWLLPAAPPVSESYEVLARLPEAEVAERLNDILESEFRRSNGGH